MKLDTYYEAKATCDKHLLRIQRMVAVLAQRASVGEYKDELELKISELRTEVTAFAKAARKYRNAAEKKEDN